MKKLLFCLFLVLALSCLTACNNSNKNNTNDDKSNISQDENQGATNTTYKTPDFSESAGFKVNLDESLKDVKYDSIFLTNNSTAQLDLQFPNNTIGTLIVDTTGSTYLYDTSDSIIIDNTEVYINVGADEIIVYEWQKDDITFVYHSKTDLRNSDTLKSLVNGTSVEFAENLMEEN